MEFEEDMGLSEVVLRGVDGKTEARVADGRSEKGRRVGGNSKLEKLTMKEDESARYLYGETDEDKKVIVRSAVSNFNSAYALVDEGAAARMSEAFGSDADKALSYGFEPGDMVWGKVKSHPWWPGHVFNEAFASASVRRTKRQGHLLVAFFGDSSYGWFEPEELVPFEPHHAEKSRQTTSRSFGKAVFEAIDEASRRCALGLTCRCRNPFNFRPMNVSGYFAVDVGGYESGAVYSVMQIKKARERFQPKEALRFVQQLALMPMSFDQRNIDAIKNRATLFAYRRAVFEEFDETYAQAFGMQPVRPGHDEMDQAAKMPIRALLSGPTAISEPLAEPKSTPKPTKKKDKYLFKRRDEANEPRPNHSGQVHESIPVPSASVEGETTTVPGDYVFQKRTPFHSTRTEVPVKEDGTGTIGGSDSLGQQMNAEVVDAVDKNSVAPNLNLADAQLRASHVGFPTVASTPAESVLDSNARDSEVAHEDGRLPLDKENVLSRRTAEAGAVDTESVGVDGGVVHNSSRTMLPETVDDLEGESFHDNLEDSQSQNRTLSVAVDDQLSQRAGDKDVLDYSPTISRHVDSQSPGAIPVASGDGLARKTKALKRPAADFNSERSLEKKKKRRKDSSIENNSENLHKRLKNDTDEEIPRMSAGRSIGIGLPSSEKSLLELQQVSSGSGSTTPSDSAFSLQKVDLENIEVDLPQVVHDMLALALDPFYGVEGDNHAVVRQVLLRFRSLVYQKSLVLPSSSEVDTSELRVGRHTTSTSVPEVPSGEDGRSLAPKHPRQIPRPEDPTRSGRKRSLSDRQEEISAKRVKKLHELKSLTERKASSQKFPEGSREQKDNNISTPSKPVKLDSAKKPESPVRMAEPAMLVLKFPQSKSLPSTAELKARFSRFGPLDLTAMRVFYKTNTCRVVFRHKVHAKAAYNYAVRNNALFGHVNVNYQLRDVGGQAPAEPEAANVQANGASDETLQLRPTGGVDSILGPRPMTPAQQRSRQSNSQLKSCLKKPSGDEAGPVVSSGPREVPRVKFMLSVEESNRAEQLMVSNSKDPSNATTGSSASADGGSSSIAMDVNSKNLLKFTPPILPPPPPSLAFPHHVQDVHQTHPIDPQINDESINFNNYFNATTLPLPPPPPIMNNAAAAAAAKTDISQQMLILMKRCNEIVTDVKCSLGYMPYHSL